MCGKYTEKRANRISFFILQSNKQASARWYCPVTPANSEVLQANSRP